MTDNTNANVIPMALLDRLETKLRTLIDRKEKNKAEFVDINIEFCTTLVQARDQFTSDNEFGRWCDEAKLGINYDTRAAAIAMGRDPNALRACLEATERNSLRHIYREEFSGFRHVAKPARTRNKSTKSRRTKRLSPRHAFTGMKRGDEMATVFVSKNGPSRIMKVVNKPGCKEIWDMILQCHDAGFIQHSSYEPEEACTLRLLFPDASKTYAAKFELTDRDKRHHVRDVIIPAALAHKDELLTNQSKLEEIVKRVEDSKLEPQKEIVKQVEESKPESQTKPTEPPQLLGIHGFKGTKTEWMKTIDPEFTGTPMDWVDKYGHVQVMTAEGYATMRFSDLVSDIRILAKRARELPERRKVDLNWLRSPKPYDVTKLTEALQYLEPLIDEAKAALVRAVTALATKEPAN